MATAAITLHSGGALSEAQLSSVHELMAWCRDEQSVGFELARRTHYLDLPCIRRILVAVRWDMKKAQRAIKETVEWREQVGVAALNMGVPTFADPARLMYMYWNGHDPTGRPILYVRMRRHNADIPRPVRIQYFLYMFELGTRLMHPKFSGHEGVERWVIVMDEKDKKSKNNDMKFLKGMGKPMFSHYVERLSTIFVMSPSLTFSLSVKVASAFIDSETKAKIKVIEKPPKDGSVHPTVAGILPAECIEAEYGGRVAEPSYEEFAARCRAVDAFAAEIGVAGGVVVDPSALGADAGPDDEDIAE